MLLETWGITSASWCVFHPILANIAKDVAEDAAKSYVQQCFKNVFSVFHKSSLVRATGLALKEVLQLIESELVRADVDEDELCSWEHDVEAFIQLDGMRDAISSLFLDPSYHLDPATFAMSWQQLEGAHSLPQGFSWQYIAKRFASKVQVILNSSKELRQTFESIANVGNAAALQEMVGLPPDFDLDKYHESLIERYASVDFASLETTGSYYSEVRLWSIFEPQSVRECHEYDPQLLEVPKEHLERLVDAGELDTKQLAESEAKQEERRRAYINQPARPVLEVTDEATTKRIVILGDPGSGKSSLLQFVALRWGQIDNANLRYIQPLPLLIELREYNRWECASEKSFPKYLHEASTWHRLNQQTLQHLLKQPDRVVVLLDGLDEVFAPAERDRVVNDIHRFSNDYKHVRIVVTSRVVGYQPHRLRNAEFRHFMLQDLDEAQIRRFLDKWHAITFDKSVEAAPKRERLVKAIENSKSIAQLAGNPLLLTMMAILNRNQKLPDDRVDLYQQCSRLLLHQWDVEGKLLEDFPGLSAEIGLREKTEILRTVAYAMQTRLSDQSRANFIDSATLTSLIEDYLHTELRFDQARAAARALVEQLRTRNFILCYLGADSYAFVHRTFLEYFCAADIVHQFNVAKTLRVEELIGLFDSHCREDDWREVLRLICGQIDEQFVGRIIEHLATRTDLETWDGETPLLDFPLAMLLLGDGANSRRLANTHRKIRILFLEVVKKRCIQLPWESFFIGVELGCSDLQGTFWLGVYLNLNLLVAFTDEPGTAIEIPVAPEFFVAMWEDLELRPVIRECLIRDLKNGAFAPFATRALAERWPEENTRELLVQQAVQDDNKGARRAALQALAERWPEEYTRELLVQQAVKDNHEDVRYAALQALAEKWQDENTRELLAQRGVQDHHGNVRSAALQALAEKWPDENTRELLAQRAVKDRDVAIRGKVWSALGKMHSGLGCILPSRYMAEHGPHLDPLEPVPRDHIVNSAKKVGISTEDIDSHLASLSEHCGWDITKGANPDNGR